jgi:predicted DNA-binding transcriptional regulator AlpA
MPHFAQGQIMAHEKPNRFRDTKEAAAYLHLSPSTLNKKRLTGDGPRYRKFGRAIRYTDEDLDAYADARICMSTSDLSDDATS